MNNRDIEAFLKRLRVPEDQKWMVDKLLEGIERDEKFSRLVLIAGGLAIFGIICYNIALWLTRWGVIK